MGKPYAKEVNLGSREIVRLRSRVCIRIGVLQFISYLPIKMHGISLFKNPYQEMTTHMEFYFVRSKLNTTFDI